ncbi:hypothetical protein [Flavobacterium sp. TBRC 19031]|uniref:hypothetical protein n=1 Tax=Flavobacterium mekongense TaxID=3379707 RepID=UPI003999EF59
MKFTPLQQEQSFDQILFTSYFIEDVKSFNDIIEKYMEFKNNNCLKTIIFTLDNLDQAEYTTTHAINMHDLDITEGHDLSVLDPVCFENGEHIGYISTPSEFFIRYQNFIKQTNTISFATACEKGLTIEEDEINLLVKINSFPLEAFDNKIILKVIPVKHSYEAFAGFPNGYFASDLNPFENYAICKHWNQKYELELFGIGASLLGFYRNVPIDNDIAKEIIADLAILYDTEVSRLEKLKSIIINNNFFFIKYIEYLQ